MSKKILYNIDARNTVINGVNKLTDAVKITLGPKGMNVMLVNNSGEPRVTKDGVSVAEHIEFADPCENAGAQLVKSVARKACEKAGDGTTTATIISAAVCNNLVGCMQKVGVNQSELIKGVNKALKVVLDFLSSSAEAIVGDYARVKQVASVSANGDEIVGELIANALKKVGSDGVITVEDGNNLATEIEVVEGMQFDKGYVSHRFVNNAKTLTSEFDDPYILIYDKKISSIHPLLKLLEEVAKTGKGLVIIAEGVDGDALTTLVVNSLRGALKVCCVDAPSFGDKRKAIMSDIAVLTGGKCISEDAGMKLENATLQDLGKAKKVKVTKDDTTIIDGCGDKNSIEGRCDEIASELASAQSDYDRNNLEMRRAKLKSGVAIVKVGGATEVEIGQKRDSIDDALHATRAAVDEGIVPGGGVALLRCLAELKKVNDFVNCDQKTGFDIMKQAIQAPAETIVENAGECGPMIVSKILESSEYAYGYDVSKGVYGNMISMGVIDPVKVTKQSIIAAVSAASMIVSIGASIYDDPDSKESSDSMPSMPSMPPMM